MHKRKLTFEHLREVNVKRDGEAVATCKAFRGLTITMAEEAARIRDKLESAVNTPEEFGDLLKSVAQVVLDLDLIAHRFDYSLAKCVADHFNRQSVNTESGINLDGYYH